MSYWKDYGYVDAHYEHPTRKRRMKWVRLRVEDVAKRIVAKARGTNCFTTVQRFKDATSLLELDRKKATPPKKNGHDPVEAARIARIKEGDELPDCQLRYHGLFFDFDCDHEKLDISVEEALHRSQEDADKLVSWFHQMFDLNPAHVQIWFSGRKGFHVLVRPEPFGIKPHNHLTYIVRSVAFELADSLGLDTLDRSVYTRRRMWRIPNTINPKSGKFKIELTAQELGNWDIGRMLKESCEPRSEIGSDDPMAWSHLWPKEEFKDITPDEQAAPWWLDRYAGYDAYKDLKNLHPRKPILTFEEAGTEYPACVKDLLTNGPKEGGPNRNRVILPLAGFMFDAGMDKREAHKAISDWTESHYPEQRFMRDRVANGKSVVESAYRGQVRFSCRFIRSCGGTGEKGRVACVKEENCSWINDPEDQEPAQVPFMHLAEASKGCYNGTKIRTAIHVATIAGRPFQLPLAGEFNCTPDPSAKICENCPNLAAGGKMKWAFDSEDRHVLNLVNVNDSVKKGTIKSAAKIPQKCYRVSIDVEEHGNLEEIQVIPMVDYANAYEMDAEDDDEIAAKGAKHVVRLAYHMGHGIEANKKYIVEPTVFGHPKDQRVCFLFDKAEPAQNDIDQFKMTPELHHKLKAFRPAKDQSVEQKLLEIHRDFTVNVHRIGGRFDLSIGVDLCFHSVIGFRFAGDDVHKGWFELVVVGDTSTGKSTLLQRMMQHFGLGELIAGEQAKRTGLIYASVQVAGQWVLIWGKIPQNDRRLLAIDEFSGIPGEEVSKMTQLRSEGKAQGGGVNAHYETFARTRMILLTNPRGNKGSLQGFNYGVEALDQLFDERSDLRRVDLAMIMEEKDVPKTIVTKRWDKVELTHKYTADLCRNLVLWAWSRNPHHVEFAPGAEDEAISWADRLGDTYECDLPLAIRTDLKLKLARVATACAARLFSTDDEAKKVIVQIEHVQFAAKFMDRCYRKSAMSFFEYARRYKQANYFTQEKKSNIKHTLESFGDEMATIVWALLGVDLITKPLFTDMVNLPQDDLKRLWKFMVREQLLRKTARGYRKTGAFTTLLKGMGVKASGYTGELSDDFETGGNFEEAMREITEAFTDEQDSVASAPDEFESTIEDSDVSSTDESEPVVDEPPF
jgi:hypothetical protein